ncbi:MAG: pyrC, partial [Mycobacterium sp.]|nr:pyrC [Mycobacterium sp.]
MNDATLLRGVSVLGGSPVDLLLAGGAIAEIGGRVEAPSDALIVVAGGVVALPGFDDLHTHLREQGLEDAETVESGTR